MVTSIREVAELAGVSIATVSRVLSGADRVSEELTERVHNAARQLNYRPNRVARRLRRPGYGTWALIVPDIANRFFTSIAKGVEEVANEHDTVLFVGNSGADPARLRKLVSTALAEQVAGLVIVPSAPDDDLEDLRKAGTPLVLADQFLAHYSDLTTVMTDHYLGGQLAGQQLLGMGCRKIGVIAGPQPDPQWNGRLAGLASIAGLEVVASVRGDNLAEGGSKAMATLLDSNPGLDGVFVTNNLMTLGVLRELTRRGLQVPHDLAVVGYDLSSEEWLPLAIPAVNQDPRRIGEIAAQQLLNPDAPLGNASDVRWEPPLILLAPKLEV